MPWEETENEIKHRVQDPSIFIQDSFTTIILKKDHPRVDAIIAKRPNQNTTEIQALRFPKEDGWTFDSAKEWAAAHPFHPVHASDAPRLVFALSDLIDGLNRIPLAKIGRWFKGKLQFRVTTSDLIQIVRNFRKRLIDLVLDYDHGTVYNAGSGQSIPAAGWVKSVDDAPDEKGVLWGSVEYTSKARQMVAAKEYKYVSPVFDWGVRDRQTGEQQGITITSVALTNQPILDLPALALSQLACIEDGWIEDNKENKPMIKQLVLADRPTGKVRVILDDNTETVLAVEGLEPPPRVLRLPEVKRTADGRFDFAALSEHDGLIHPEVLRAMTVQTELDDALKAGKITPAQRPTLEKLALSDLRGFLQSQKTQIDLAERGFAGAETANDVKSIDNLFRTEMQKKLATNNQLTPGQALSLVASEHPDLAERRRQLILREGN